MPVEYNRSRGSTPGSRPTAGGANIRSVPVFGIVKDNIDPTRAGRLRVYISDFGGKNPDDSDSWISVGYMSNFFGSVRPKAGETGFGTYKDNPSSYGEWHAPPDIGTTVICLFINGDMNYGYYIGCVPNPEELRMVPAIGAMETIVPNEEEAKTYGGASRLPVTNINTNNESIANSADFLVAARPVHSYSAAIMAQQGVIRDSIRGPISSSAQREPSSRVGWGVSTPGRPIYEGGFNDETIVTQSENATPESLRIVARRGGHSIVMDDGDVKGSDQLIRIRTALGHQITMSDDGQTLMILHSNGQSYIELGKEGTVDVYSTNSVNIRTQGDLNLHADNNVNIHATKEMNFYAENMNVTTEKAFNQRVGTNYKNFTMGTHTNKVTGAMSFESKGEASFASKGIAYVNGSRINLNTGKASTVPEEVDAVPVLMHTDTLFDDSKGFSAAPGKLKSITSRAPAHAPWNEAGKGVDVKVDLTSSSQLPSSSSGAVNNATTAGIGAGVLPISTATIASAPSVPAISGGLDVNASSALLGAAAQTTAQGPFAAAQQQGAAIIPTRSGNTLAVGSFGQTLDQLANAGVVKPGSDRLMNSLAQSGASVDQCMPDNMFTGQRGAENLTNYVQNIPAQANTSVTTMQRSQTELTQAGVITGKESPEELAGVVLAGSTTGTQETVNTLRTVNSGQSAGTNAQSIGVLRQIGTGSVAATTATATSGGMEGLMTSLSAASTVNFNSGGVASSSFNAVSSGFANMTANKPQNLSVINKAAANKVSFESGLPNTASSVSASASGINNLPGGDSVVSTNVNKILPGIAALSTQLKNVATAKLNDLASTTTLSSGSKSLKSAVTSTLAIGAAAQLLSGLASLSSQGKQKSKIPVTATNTTNRAPIEQATTSLLNDSKIPAPNLSGEISEGVTSRLDELEKINEEIRKNTTDQQEITSRWFEKRRELAELRNSAPAGDPRINSLEREVAELSIQRREAQNKQFSLYNDRRNLETTIAVLGK
jgi:hypothetical protein